MSVKAASERAGQLILGQLKPASVSRRTSHAISRQRAPHTLLSSMANASQLYKANKIQSGE
ncbi:hypothetical protein CSPX01_01246 [Colletotrichum filicis]|nr:hypothetical protein CSPX01_01246 [Colletotrichum filicis]